MTSPFSLHLPLTWFLGNWISIRLNLQPFFSWSLSTISESGDLSVKLNIWCWSIKWRGIYGLLISAPAASLTRGQWFSTGSLLSRSACTNLKVNLARVRKLSFQSANDRWIMDGPINEAWHEFYIPDPAGNEIKWVLNVALTTVTAHKSLFCTNFHVSRFHESQIKFTFDSSGRVWQQKELCLNLVWQLLHPFCRLPAMGSRLLSRLFLFMVRGSCLTRFPCGAANETGAKTRKRKSHLESDQQSSTFHLQLRDRQNTEEQKKTLFWETTAPFPPSDPEEDFPNPWCVSTKITQGRKKTPQNFL